jgi:serine phosphatase RsbU (regulator of sigma subunit)
MVSSAPETTDESLRIPLARTTQAVTLAAIAALLFFLAAGIVETTLIRFLRLSALELDWISDAVLSMALGVAVYLWLHLHATRLALTARERAQLVIHAQLSLAENMQRRLLPSVPASSDGLEWAAVLLPAGRIGGDFYDFVESPSGARFMLIADVSGKGISAAMALTLLRAAFRNLGRQIESPAQLASRMSSAFYEEWRGTPYVTCVIARLDPLARTLTYTNAGHPHGILVRDGADRGLGEGGPPLGLLKEARYVEESLDLVAGDVCAFVTDGVTEAFDQALLPCRAVVVETVLESPESAAAICNAIMSRAGEGQGPQGVDDWTDDRTVVVMAVTDREHQRTADRLQDAGAGRSQPLTA